MYAMICTLRRAVAASLLAGSCTAFCPMPPAFAETRIAVLPPDYAGDKPALIERFAETIDNLADNDRLLIYAAQGPRLLAEIIRPTGPKASNAAWRKRQQAAAFAPVKDYLDRLPAVPAAGLPAGDLALTDVMAEIGANVASSLPAGHEAQLLLIGSLRHADPRDPATAIVNRRYPSDGYLSLDPTQSAYGVAGAERRLAGVTVHFCTLGGAAQWETPEYQARVERFWSLFVTRQSGRVGTVSPDLATCFARFASGVASVQATYKSITSGKAEMLEAPRAAAVPPADLGSARERLFRKDTPISTVPPSTRVGPVQIGLRWEQSADIDLYVNAGRGTLRGEAVKPEAEQWLFFGNTRTDEGYFDRDFQAATGNQQSEFVAISKPVDLANVEVRVNFYDGDLPAPPAGVIRVLFAGKVYQGTFQLQATRGNHGALPMTGPHWTRIDLRQIVGLSPS